MAATFGQHDRGERDAEHESLDEDDEGYAPRHQHQRLAAIQGRSARALLSNGLVAVAPVGDEANPPTNAILLAKDGLPRNHETQRGIRGSKGRQRPPHVYLLPRNYQLRLQGKSLYCSVPETGRPVS